MVCDYNARASKLRSLLLALALIATGGMTAAPAAELSTEFLVGPMSSVGEIVFAVRSVSKGIDGFDGHWYANIGYYATSREPACYGQGGRLCKLNVRTGKMTVLLEDIAGAVRDPVVHYDGKRILFSYRRGGTDNYLL